MALSLAARRNLARLEGIRAGELHLIGPGNQSVRFIGDASGPTARMHVGDWDAVRDLFRQDRPHCADAYLLGRWSAPDLPALLTLADINRRVWLKPRLPAWCWPLLRRFTGRPGRNIHTRRRLQRAFYEPWLDVSMAYSCALYGEHHAVDLETAQGAKYEAILQDLGVQAGQSLLDMGCGWGGFALYAARSRRCNVHAVTISQAQADRVRETVMKQGLQRFVRVSHADFREVHGPYDRVVSIEAYETLGRRIWLKYLQHVAGSLTAAGRAFIQGIVVPDGRAQEYLRSTDFVRQHIQPRAMLASPGVFGELMSDAGLAVQSMRTLTDDYVRTLAQWRHRFGQARPRLRLLGLDESLLRLWDYYLAYCEAGFRTGRTELAQWLVARR